MAIFDKTQAEVRKGEKNWNDQYYPITVNFRDDFEAVYREAAKEVAERRLMPTIRRLAKIEQDQFAKHITAEMMDKYRRLVSEVHRILDLKTPLNMMQQTLPSSLFQLTDILWSQSFRWEEAVRDYHHYEDWRYTACFAYPLCLIAGLSLVVPFRPIFFRDGPSRRFQNGAKN